MLIKIKPTGITFHQDMELLFYKFWHSPNYDVTGTRRPMMKFPAFLSTYINFVVVIVVIVAVLLTVFLVKLSLEKGMTVYLGEFN